MDKNKIKSFAIWARRNLIAAVSEKANRIGISESKIEEAIGVQGGFKLEGKDEIFPLSKSDRDALVSQVREKGFEQVMEEVAYTWFNRFMGLRYMEVNDYLPTGVRILSSSIEGKIEPDVLTKVSEIIDELCLNANEVYDLLDTGDTLDREKAYRIILVRQCNELGKIIPQMFEKISDYTELILPDNLLEEGSVIRKMVEDIEESDWLEEVEIIGWMYQYYISEKKDEVFAALDKNVKITKENIPAATQIFTPKWIVKYMVENSLGRLWLEGHPNEELQKEFKYYLEEAEQEQEVEEELQKIREEHAKLKPEDIKVLDPCMGSGHILVYAFDVLYEIYKTVGYSEREIPRMILKNNLYGLDIDDRAAQLASFALIMKARHYNRRLFREIEKEYLELNLCSIRESNILGREEIDYFCTLGKGVDNNELRSAIEYLCEVFIDAKEYGSILEVKRINFEVLKDRLFEVECENDLMFGDYRKLLLEKIPVLIKQASIMSEKFEICVTNPPYMSNKGMSNNIKNMLNKKYVDSKSDLFAVLMERGIKFLNTNGLCSIINQHSWMFLSSYEKLRQKIINGNSIVSMVHLGTRAFEEIGGEVVQTTTLVLSKNKKINYKTKFIDVTKLDSSKKKEYKVLFGNNDSVYCKNIDEFKKIPGNQFAYWADKRSIEVYKTEKKILDVAEVKTGIQTGNNEKFLRYWFEINYENMGRGCSNYSDINRLGYKWYPYNKGGSLRKWYGNNEYVINMFNNGEEIKNQGKNANYRLRNPELYFKQSITWSFVSSGSLSVRFSPKGFLFDVGGSSLFPNNEDILYILGVLGSSIATQLLKLQNPTMNYQVENINKFPLVIPDNKEMVNRLVNQNIDIQKYDWDMYEESWDYRKNPLLYDDINTKNIELCVNKLKEQMQFNIEKLFNNEKKLDEVISEIYSISIQEEVIYKNESDIDNCKIIKSFISYIVGCILGRYSIDIEGLIYAGGEFESKWNITDKKIRNMEKDEGGNIRSDTWDEATFIPDADNIIPITEDEYFEDDIVSRFIEFVKTVYGEETLEENLDFIADSIVRKASETARQAIRRYFIKDFYKDHLKVYQKRPIYWMFESGKNNGFKCLVYMHRYNDQTVAKVRTDYLHTLQRKYESEINRLQLVVDSEEYTAKDRTVAKKKIDRISKQLEECKEYDQVVAHLANEKISIDLDDGVKVNYAKFQDVKVINSKGKEVKMNLLSKI